MPATLRVSVGIPAYNEEGNIGNLIENLLNQNQGHLVLEKIIVASDGSTDRTEEIVRGFKDSRVILLADGKREGQPFRQNEILAEFDGDVIVLLNGDVLPVDDQFLNNITRPFLDGNEIGVVSGRPVPANPDNLFERIINHSVLLKDYLVGQINGGHNILNCHGSVRAFSAKFANEFKWSTAVSEDAYSYLACRERGYGFMFESTAKVYRKSPQNLRDHIKQSARFEQGQTDLIKFFPEDLVVKEHSIPFKYMLKALIVYFLKNPLLLIGYIAISIYSRLLVMNGANYAVLKWEPSQSSKKLINK